MIVQMFELHCNGCEVRFEISVAEGVFGGGGIFDFSITSHSDVRAMAKKRGWARKRCMHASARCGPKDYCPTCKGKH
jgi:hypothetical protein